MLTRAKRVGVAWQRLRRSAALFLEWFWLCVRHGWLASPRARKTRRNAVMHFGMSAGSRLKNGRAAIAAGLAATAAGSRRPVADGARHLIPNARGTSPEAPARVGRSATVAGPSRRPFGLPSPARARREALRPAGGAGLRSFRRSFLERF